MQQWCQRYVPPRAASCCKRRRGGATDPRRPARARQWRRQGLARPRGARLRAGRLGRVLHQRDLPGGGGGSGKATCGLLTSQVRRRATARARREPRRRFVLLSELAIPKPSLPAHTQGLVGRTAAVVDRVHLMGSLRREPSPTAAVTNREKKEKNGEKCL